MLERHGEKPPEDLELDRIEVVPVTDAEEERGSGYFRFKIEDSGSKSRVGTIP